jgi:3-oxoacyl-[acyl-carrier protein] reductase
MRRLLTMADKIRLDGKVAIVSGAGRGLGRAMALALAEAGATVIGADILGENIAGVAEEGARLTNAGRLVGMTADLRRAEDCRKVVDAAAALGGPDILVNNAGLLPAYAYPGRLLEGAPPGKFWKLPDEVVENTMASNFLSHDRMTRYAVPLMLAKGWGRIVNVTTRLSTMNRSGGFPYGASKAALEMASEIWKKDLAGTGVTVNILNPGAAADTPGFASIEEKRYATSARRLHMMHPDQMRAPVVWLVSSATDGINGMRYDAVAWDASRPAEEQAALHGRPLGFELKPDAAGNRNEVSDDKASLGTRAIFDPQGG